MLIVGWDCSTASVYDSSAFQHLVESVEDEVVVFADAGFTKKGWHPEDLRVCKRGKWNVRMVVETVLSMLTTVCPFKKVTHRVWTYFKSRLAYTMALFNLLVQWHGLSTVTKKLLDASFRVWGSWFVVQGSWFLLNKP